MGWVVQPNPTKRDQKPFKSIEYRLDCMTQPKNYLLKDKAHSLTQTTLQTINETAH